MSVETNVKIRRYSSGEELHGADDTFLRRDYDLSMEIPELSLTSGVKTEIRTVLSTIEYLYIAVTGDSATISLFQNRSPGCWQFNNCFLVIGAEDVTSFHLRADAGTTVSIYVAGT